MGCNPSPVIHYFAYGSNMNSDRVSERGLGTLGLCGAVLEGYRLAFNKASGDSCTIGHANVEYDTENEVEGVLYELSDSSEILKMDPFEKAPVNYGREALEVRISERKVWAWIYIANPAVKREGLAPEKWYKEHLLLGKPYLSNRYYNFLKKIEVIDN